MKIAVDFDGTCVDHMYPEVGQDVPECVSVLRDFIARGDKIYLFTMRSGWHLVDAVAWFGERDIDLSGINTDPEQSSWTSSPKCFANLYIDDLAYGCPLIDIEGFSGPVVDWMDIRDNLLGE